MIKRGCFQVCWNARNYAGRVKLAPTESDLDMQFLNHDYSAAADGSWGIKKDKLPFEIYAQFIKYSGIRFGSRVHKRLKILVVQCLWQVWPPLCS